MQSPDATHGDRPLSVQDHPERDRGTDGRPAPQIEDDGFVTVYPCNGGDCCMTPNEQDWRGEHLIRCAPRSEVDEPDTRMNELDVRRKKVAKLINMQLTAPEIAQHLGCSDSIVYKDAAKLKMNLTGAKAPGRKRKAA